MSESAKPVEVRDFLHGDETLWDDYVGGHGDGTFLQLSGWRSVYEQFDWIRPRHLMAYRDDNLVGVMPIASVTWGVGSKALVSTPFCVTGGALADDAETRFALEAHAIELGRASRHQFLELRCITEISDDSHAVRRYANFCRTLGSSEEENLNQIPRKQRAMIRKGEAVGLRFVKEIDIDSFLPLYQRSMRFLGTPCYPNSLFRALLSRFNHNVRISGVEHEGQLVAAVLNFYYRGRVMPYYSGALPVARKLKAYDYLYWQILCDAFEAGARQFDFGRSLIGSGAYAFKKNWGFEPEPLHYRVISLEDKKIRSLDPDSRVNQLARRCWTRIPLPIANAIGPILSRRLV